MKYRPIEKKNPQDRSQSKFYVQPVRSGTWGRREIETYLVEKTALSKAEARGVTITLVDFIKEELLKGNAIKVEGLGTFSIRVKSDGSDTADEVTAKNVKSVIISFRSDRELREEVSKVKFEKVSD
ncbi:HU family DNA-binding protein [Marinifilum fragile]|uniref:HU family DNA-binding protein n=1 Tax=Marinifilum fragile TaxID=570161 RepID=UPI002AA6287C|nr:HU family DNA-binding protein [Marinifilum fragile]